MATKPFNRGAFVASPFFAALVDAPALSDRETKAAQAETVEDQKTYHHVCWMKAKALRSLAESHWHMNIALQFAGADTVDAKAQHTKASTELMKAMSTWSRCAFHSIDQVRNFRQGRQQVAIGNNL